MTNTRIKLIIVIEEHSISVPIRENDIRMVSTANSKSTLNGDSSLAMD